MLACPGAACHLLPTSHPWHFLLFCQWWSHHSFPCYYSLSALLQPKRGHSPLLYSPLTSKTELVCVEAWMRVNTFNSCSGPGHSRSILKDPGCVGQSPLVSGSLGRLKGPGAGSQGAQGSGGGNWERRLRTEAN